MYETTRVARSPVPIRHSLPIAVLPGIIAGGQRQVNPRRVRILLADSHELARAGLESIVRRYRSQWDIVGQATDGRQALVLAESLQPDLLVLDVALPEMNGLEVVERLSRTSPRTRIMILTMHPAASLIRTSRRLGVRAYVSKNELPANIVVAMDRIMAGESFFTSERFRPENAHAAEPGAALPSQYLLTGRELDVMRRLAAGCKNKQTAEALGMSVRTAESHRASILHKLGAASIGDLVRIAVRDGLL